LARDATPGVGRTPASSTSPPSAQIPAHESRLQERTGTTSVATQHERHVGPEDAGRGPAEGRDELRGELAIGDAANAVGSESQSHDETPMARLNRLEYCGALRAFFNPYFRPLFLARVASEKAGLLERGTELVVEGHEGSSDAQPQRNRTDH